VVIARQLRALGFDGGLSILKEHLHSVRPNTQSKRAYVRMEPGPGERFEIDWGHFGVLSYRFQQVSSRESGHVSHSPRRGEGLWTTAAV
jgi:hypothetical protein